MVILRATDAASWPAFRGRLVRATRLLVILGVVVLLATQSAGSAALGPAPGPGARALLPIGLSASSLGQARSFGVQVYWSDPTIEQAVASAGARWLRVPFEWAWVEPDSNLDPDDYVWPVWYDARIAAHAANGVQPVLTFGGNPGWAAEYPGGPLQVDPSVLAEFMAAAVLHYAEPPYNVRYWEMYNEPDNASEMLAIHGWGFFGDQPLAYVDLLAAVYPAVKAAHPGVRLLIGGLAYDRWREEDPNNPFVKAFLDQVLQLGGGSYFDIMNFHYYPLFHTRWDAFGPDILGKAAYLQAKLASYGVHKPLACTETSMWSDALHGGSHELQSRYVPQVYARALAADLDIVIWHALADTEGVGDYEYGLLDADLNPKPSFFAYQTMTGQLAGTRFVRSLEPGDTGSSTIEAYEIVTSDLQTRIVVAWTSDGSGQVIALPASEIVSLDKFGAESILLDADDGVMDGQVHAPLGGSPVYLRSDARGTWAGGGVW